MNSTNWSHEDNAGRRSLAVAKKRQNSESSTYDTDGIDSDGAPSDETDGASEYEDEDYQERTVSVKASRRKRQLSEDTEESDEPDETSETSDDEPLAKRRRISIGNGKKPVRRVIDTNKIVSAYKVPPSALAVPLSREKLLQRRTITPKSKVSRIKQPPSALAVPLTTEERRAAIEREKPKKEESNKRKF